MKTKEKILIAADLIASFVVVGGIACTYSTSKVVNPVLAGLLGVLLIVAVGILACSRSTNKFSD